MLTDPEKKEVFDRLGAQGLEVQVAAERRAQNERLFVLRATRGCPLAPGGGGCGAPSAARRTKPPAAALSARRASARRDC